MISRLTVVLLPVGFADSAFHAGCSNTVPDVCAHPHYRSVRNGEGWLCLGTSCLDRAEHGKSLHDIEKQMQFRSAYLFSASG